MDRDVPSTEVAGQPVALGVLDGQAGSTATAMIARIAVALGIPSGALARSPTSHGERARMIAQNAEATDIFAGITDPTAREQALAYLRWIAEQTELR